MTQQPQIWSAKLNNNSKHYREWKNIFTNTDDIPLVSPVAFSAVLGNERDVIMLLDWNDLDDATSDRLLQHFSHESNIPKEELEDLFNREGYVPIRNSDVFVVYRLGAYI